MPRTFLSKAGARIKAVQRQTYLDTLKVILFKDGWMPTPASELQDYLDHECDFSGYARVSIASLNEIALLAVTSWLLYSNTMAHYEVTDPAPDPVVPNNVLGMAVLVQTAAGPPAVYDLGPVTVFDAIVPMGLPGTAIDQVVQEVEAN